MDKIKQNTSEPAWILVSRNYELHEDIIFRIPNFMTIKRFLLVGGGKIDDIYNKMMGHMLLILKVLS